MLIRQVSSLTPSFLSHVFRHLRLCIWHQYMWNSILSTKKAIWLPPSESWKGYSDHRCGLKKLHPSFTCKQDSQKASFSRSLYDVCFSCSVFQFLWILSPHTAYIQILSCDNKRHTETKLSDILTSSRKCSALLSVPFFSPQLFCSISPCLIWAKSDSVTLNLFWNPWTLSNCWIPSCVRYTQ